MSISTCTTAQNFCSSCQTGAQILSESDIAITQKKQFDLNTNEAFIETKDILQKLHDYGLLGSRSWPSEEDVSAIPQPKQFDITFFTDYGKLLETINVQAPSDFDSTTVKSGKTYTYTTTTTTTTEQQKLDEEGNPMTDEEGNPVMEEVTTTVEEEHEAEVPWLGVFVNGQWLFDTEEIRAAQEALKENQKENAIEIETGKGSLIAPEILAGIQQTLNQYKIDYNRCNDCNTTGNCAQCGDCSDGGGGCGDCSDGGCCMYGGCGDINSGCHLNCENSFCDY